MPFQTPNSAYSYLKKNIMKTAATSSSLSLSFVGIAIFVLLAAGRLAFSLVYLESTEYISGSTSLTLNVVWFGITLFTASILVLAMHRTIRSKVPTDADRYVQSNSSVMYVIRMDIYGNYKSANLSFLETFVAPEGRNTIEGRSSLVHIVPEDHAAAIRARERCFANPSAPAFVSLRKSAADGRILTTEWEFVAICNADGVVLEIQCSGWDSTERKRLEMQLWAEHEHTAALMNAINSIVWEADAATLEFTYVSNAAERMLGYPAKSWTTEPNFWASHIHPDDRDVTVRYCIEATKAMRDHDFEYRFMKSNGSVVWLRDIVTVVSQDGKAVSLKGVMVDITEQKNIARGLRNAEEHFRSAVNALGEGIILQDENGVIAFCNPRAEEILGLSAAQMAGLTSFEPRWESVRADGSPFPREEFPAVHTLRTGEPKQNVVMGVHHANGSLIWLLVNSQPIRYASIEKVSGVVVSFTDITLQRVQEEQLHHITEQLRLAIEGSGVGLWDWYVQTGKTIFNERWAEILGYSLTELAPTSIDTWVQNCHPDDIKHSNKLLQAHFRKETDYYECETRMRHKSGEWIWVLGRGKVAEWNNDSAPHRMTGTHSDITERKKAEIALRQSEERFRIIIETEPECVKVVDKNGFLLEMNAAGLAMLEAQTLQEVQQSSLSSFILPEHRPAFGALHARVIGGKSGVLEFEIQGKKGTRRWLETHAAPMRDTDTGNITKLLGVTRDITERKKAEEELRASETNLRAIFDASVQIHCLLDHDLRLMTVNKIATDAARQILQRELLLGDNILDYVPSANKEQFEHYLRGALRGEVTRYEESVRAPNVEQTWWFEFQFIPVHNASGSVVGVSFSALDITERKAMLLRMAESSQELQNIIDSMMDGLLVLNEERRIVLVNPALQQMFGYAEKELLGADLSKLVPERFHSTHEQYIEHFAHNDRNRQRTRTAVGRHAEGFEFPMDSSIASFRYGNATMTLAIVRDITESKAQEDKIRQSEANLRAIMDSSVQAFWLTDTEFRIQTFNKLTAYIVKRTFGREIIPGDCILNYVLPDRQERFLDSAHKALRGEVVLYEEQFLGDHGEEQWFELMYLPTYNAEGIITGLTLSSFNITERKIAYQELTKLNDDLEDRVEERTRELVQLNNEKNEFLGIAAHDLKNPLAGILSSAEILDRYYSGDISTQRFAKMIISASEQMLDIITNLLDVNRIESGLMTLNLQPVNLDMLADIVEEHQNRAAQKGIFIHYDRPELNTAWVLGDIQSVRQIVDNLISNAVKYSPLWKKVWVRVLHRHDADGHFVRVEVQDEGQGLNEDDKQKLFGKFARLSAQPTGGENTTGLGLSIVKRLVEMQNGRIRCESTFGLGATFIVELPGA